MTNTEQSSPLSAQSGGTSHRRRPLVLGAIVLGGLALGAGGLAFAATVQGQFDFHRGPRLALIQQFALRALDSIGATSAQEAKVHDIIAAAFADIVPGQEEHEALRQHVLDLLRTPTIDRAAVEKLRADHVADIEAKSKKIVAAILDIADQLTPEQRAKLVAHVESMDGFGPMMRGRWHSMQGAPDGDRLDQGPDGMDKN
jgi:Spy/CpxP family protein refolding chaperone